MKTLRLKIRITVGVLAALTCVFGFGFNPVSAQMLDWQKWAYGTSTDRIRATLGCDGELISNKSTTVAADGNLILTGCYPNNPNSIAGDSNFESMLTVKLSGSTGAELWRKAFVDASFGNRANQGIAVAVDSMGDVLIAGRRNGKFALTKLRGSNGDELWATTEPESNTTAESIALALAIDQNNDIVVTGIGSTTFGSQSAAPTMLTVKFRGGSGAIAWTSQLPNQEDPGSVGRALALTESGDAIITGTDNGSGRPALVVVKLASASGGVLWRHEHGVATRDQGEGHALALDNSGNVIAAGIFQQANKYLNDALVIKLNIASGQLIWRKLTNTSLTSSSAVYALAINSAQEIFATGYSTTGFRTNGTLPDPQTLTFKLNGVNGATIWSRSLTPQNQSRLRYGTANSLGIDAAGNIVIGLKASNESQELVQAIKYDGGSGSLLWSNEITAPSSVLDPSNLSPHVSVSNIGEVFISGSFGSLVMQPIVIRKIGGSNEQLWSTTTPNGLSIAVAPGTLALGSAAPNVGVVGSVVGRKSSAIDKDGNLIVTGGRPVSASAAVAFTEKYERSTGRSLWRKPFVDNATTGAIGAPLSIICDSSNDIIIGGGKAGYGSATVLKHDGRDGTLKWVVTTPTLPTRGATGNAIVALGLDSANNIFATGGNATYKFAAIDGTIIWKTTFTASAGIASSNYALAVDSSNDVGVVVQDAAGNNFIVKYNGQSGIEVWRKLLSTDQSGFAKNGLVAVDKAGDFIAAASATSLAGDQSVITAKFRGADGVLIWVETFDGSSSTLGQLPTSRSAADQPYGLALDSVGNAFVTGQSSERNAFAVMRTLKYAAQDGALLWTHSVVAPFSSAGASVAITGENDAIVTGGAFDGLKTIKLRGADGQTLWQNTIADNLGQAIGHSISISGNVAYVAGVSAPKDLAPTWTAIRFTHNTPTALTEVALTVTPNLVQFGKPATLVATVNGNAPSGTVRFMAQGIVIPGCHALAVIAGTATCLTSSLVAGAVDLIATYGGDSNNQGSADRKRIIVDSGAVYIAQNADDFNRVGKSNLLVLSTGQASIWTPNGNPTFYSALLPTPEVGYLPVAIGTLGVTRDSAILWRKNDGGLIATQMQGANQIARILQYGVYPGYTVEGMVDIDDDGIDDIVWRDDNNGNVYVWFLNAQFAVSRLASWGGADATWRIAGIADLNGDGATDLVWRSKTGLVYAYLSTSDRTFTVNFIGSADTNWDILAVGDMDGDRNADIIWNNNAGSTVIWKMAGLRLTGLITIAANARIEPSSFAHLADINGDGRLDIITVDNNRLVRAVTFNGLWQITNESLGVLPNGATLIAP